MDSHPDAITRLYRACDPRLALDVEDPRYVNCDDVRGVNLTRDVAQSLRRSDSGHPETKIFAGHFGVGKTSELLRLKHRLEHPREPDRKPFLVVFSDVTQALDMNDLAFPDLLVFMAGEVQRQLGEAGIPGFSATSEYLSRLWDEFQDLLGSEVVVAGAKSAIPYSVLALELRNRPGARRVLREKIEEQSGQLIDAVNDLLRLAAVRLRESGREDLVLIIDGLDKMVRRDLAEGGNTHDRLFVHRGDQLANLEAHAIYTVPISLVYSPQFTRLGQTLGEHHVPVPMIRLRDDNLVLSDDTPGMRRLGEMLEARCRYADVDFEDLFDDGSTRSYLCRMSGGHPRHLIMFFQTAINAVDVLPVTREAVEKAIRLYGNSLKRGMPDEYWPKLRKFATPQDDIPTDADHQEMLLLLHIFEYMNGTPWYEVNPVIRELSRFRE